MKEKITNYYKHIVVGSKMAFMFAGPGNYEKVANKPVVGATGSNLDELLIKLNKKDGENFPSKDRYDYTILNASDKLPANKDSEPDGSEIEEESNVNRLKEEIKESKPECIIPCGRKARKAIEAIGKGFFTEKIS